MPSRWKVQKPVSDRKCKCNLEEPNWVFICFSQVFIMTCKAFHIVAHSSCVGQMNSFLSSPRI